MRPNSSLYFRSWSAAALLPEKVARRVSTRLGPRVHLGEGGGPMLLVTRRSGWEPCSTRTRRQCVWIGLQLHECCWTSNPSPKEKSTRFRNFEWRRRSCGCPGRAALFVQNSYSSAFSCYGYCYRKVSGDLLNGVPFLRAKGLVGFYWSWSVFYVEKLE